MRRLDPDIEKMVDRMTIQLTLLLTLQLIAAGNILYIFLKLHG